MVIIEGVNMMIYGYSRVSTESQRDNNSREAQEKMLREAGAEKIFHDVMSGAKTDRPQLTALLSEIQPGDTLIICKLDRLSRTAVQGFELIQSLMDKGITVRVLNIGTMDNSATGKLIMQIFLAFAEFEKDTIRGRMQEGKAIAKQKPGYREGRPKVYGRKRLDHALEMLSERSYKQVSEETGISISTLSREVRRRKAEQLRAESEVQPS